MKEYIKVLDHKNLVRDAKSNAILSTDIKGLEEFNKKRELERSKLKKEQDLIDAEKEFKDKVSKALEKCSLEIKCLHEELNNLKKLLNTKKI